MEKNKHRELDISILNQHNKTIFKCCNTMVVLQHLETMPSVYNCNITIYYGNGNTKL